MLVLTRKKGQALRIGGAVVRILVTRGGFVRLGIDAPADVPIVCEEVDQSGTADGSTGQQVELRCGLSARLAQAGKADADAADRFRPVRRLQRRNPDAGADARLKPGSCC
ncbi:hypothetical protein GC176_00045 [bacterium]|nr:hypothetical protein [bacterium]